MGFQDHFSKQASDYARARPSYPDALFDALSALAPGRALAWDAGTGNGQAALGLAARFAQVVATEPSAAQLAQAPRHARITYHQSAETAPWLVAASVDLCSVAQAAHWFDLAAYYAEVQRVARPDALVALWTYALCAIDPELDGLVHHFYEAVVGPYWPPERVHCMNGYRALPFPFYELPFPALDMELTWDLATFVDYLATWSAVARYRKQEKRDPIAPLKADLARAWGDPREPKRVRWPLAGRLGRVHPT